MVVDGWVRGTIVDCVETEDLEVTCDDGIDNDCDGLIDEDDPDCPATEFLRGDADGNGRHNVVDVITMVRTVLGSIALPFACEDVYDANDDGCLDIADAVTVVLDLFQREEPGIAPPRDACGRDRRFDELASTESNCR